MAIDINGIGDMIKDLKDNMSRHNPDLNTWSTNALYGYVTGVITLHEVGLLEKVHDLNIQLRLERYRIYTIIENARHKGYLE